MEIINQLDAMISECSQALTNLQRPVQEALSGHLWGQAGHRTDRHFLRRHPRPASPSPVPFRVIPPASWRSDKVDVGGGDETD